MEYQVLLGNRSNNWLKWKNPLSIGFTRYKQSQTEIGGRWHWLFHDLPPFSLLRIDNKRHQYPDKPRSGASFVKLVLDRPTFFFLHPILRTDARHSVPSSFDVLIMTRQSLRRIIPMINISSTGKWKKKKSTPHRAIFHRRTLCFVHL